MSHEPKSADEYSPEQEACVEQWRITCFSLERAQGDNVAENCSDKYEFAKTYLNYGKKFEQVLAEVKHSAKQGNFNFFGQCGIDVRLLNYPMAKKMMTDWRDSLASKRAHLSDVFLRRFGEEIDSFIGTPHHASRLMLATSFDETDAVLQLSEATQSQLSALELARMRTDIAQIKSQLDQLVATVVRGFEQLSGEAKDDSPK